MKLTSDSETLAENKVLILYILNKLDKPIDNEGLLMLVLSIQEMNYFYFQQFLLDLLENSYIIGYMHENEMMYKITEEGKRTLELTNDLLPGIIKLKIDHSLANRVQEVQNTRYPTAEFIPKNEEEFTVHCKLIENGLTTFEITLPASSREQAKTIATKWEKNYFEVSAIIMELLTRKEKDEEN